MGSPLQQGKSKGVANMGGNGDLVREATMRRVRRHIRTGIEAGRDPADLTDEVIRTYDLSPVEAGLVKTMVRHRARGRGAAERQR
jgi:hypothetical protein